MSEQEQSEAPVIRFYRTGDSYGALSNFAPYPISLDEVVWPTSEHFFQAQKFLDAAYRERIRAKPSPMRAAELGRSRKVQLRADWEEVKDDVMRRAVWAKFTQHAALGELLLATGDATLVEHTPHDSYWADGGDGSGRNMLGRILMETRDRLARERG